MFNSDFVWLNFDRNFNDGDTETRTFSVDGNPSAAHPEGQGITSEGYILIQAEDVGTPGDDGERTRNRVTINGNELPAFDMVSHEGLSVWMDRIPEGFLQQGGNRLTVRAVNDSFRVLNIVVHWRERLATAKVAAAE